MTKLSSRKQLTDHVNHGGLVDYLFFWGHRKKKDVVSSSCFSQWYDAGFEQDGERFLTAEHYMMYHKAKLFGDQLACERVLQATNPGDVKAIGREVLGFDQSLWEKERFDIVVNGNLAKFSQHAALKGYLVATGSKVLVEASPVDRIWGIGLAKDDPAAQNPNSWKGENLLGFALMEVRQKLA